MNLPAHLQFLGDQLTLEGVSLDSLAKTYGTPLMVYSHTSIQQAIHEYQQAFTRHKMRLCYAVKANSNLSILKLCQGLGCGFDIVSIGELKRLQAIGVSAQTVVFSGVGKTALEMREALKAGIGCFNVESEAELLVLQSIAQELGLVAKISLRVNPDIDAQTHPYISTGLKNNKFGIAHTLAIDLYLKAFAMPYIQVMGIDCHIGSQITELAPFMSAAHTLSKLILQIEKESGQSLQHIDFGGGLGIDYYAGTAVDINPTELFSAVLPIFQDYGLTDKTFFIEPGRSIVANSGVCVTQVLYLKEAEEKNFCIVDVAMNDLPRPAMYQAYHHILATRKSLWPAKTYDVVGPVCESGDWLGRDRHLNVQPQNLLAILSTGAYCSSMASNYNTRPRMAEVMVHQSQVQLIRHRESLDDILRPELACLAQ
ncbi:MAG: diaminopimelate decarboxylase [Gammaproteobacteria bacterium]|nr:diaminopimelate decarboxylase [Gammaproteobacteria bacterium]